MIHERLHALILRKRWINWCLRMMPFYPMERMLMLSERLAKWRPTYDEGEFIHDGIL
jgi:hypothetical protein